MKQGSYQRGEPYFTAYRTATREAEAMTDGALCRAYADAVAADNARGTQSTAGRERSLYDEMEHRDCWT